MALPMWCNDSMDDDFGMRWFGPKWPSYLTQVGAQTDTPFDRVCPHCEEPFELNDMGVMLVDGNPLHLECFERTIFGSLGHQLKTCSCHGGTRSDPAGMTIRQAARLASEFFHFTRDRIEVNDVLADFAAKVWLELEGKKVDASNDKR